MEIKNKIRPIAFLVSFILLINVSSSIIRKIKKENMYKKEIKGIVWDIILRRGGHHYYYNNNDYFIDDDFFNDRNNENIYLKDSVYKPAENDTLYIYKKNINTYKLYKKAILRR